MAKQTQSFNAEIKQLLDIVIHSLYSQKEIFLRELISNASDAIDKLKFQSLTDSKILPEGWQPAIRIQADPTAKTLQISDNGIGMTGAEVTEFIGTIARSGAKAFTQFTKEMKDRPELIGQFGVGFYSAFMVADRVELHTQKAGTTEGTLWESTGDGSYSTESKVRAEGTGTSITLHLKSFSEDQEVANFADNLVIKGLIKKYSDFISFPIKLITEKDEEIVNSQKALWLRPPGEVTAQEHKEFYQHLSYDFQEPLKTIQYKAEGSMEFNALLYIPSQRPWNYTNVDREFGLSLYIKRVFIMADCKDLLPAYLRFVKGLVDSADLSLNVSRELLQQDRQVTMIRKNVVTKILAALKDLFINDRTKYENFWSAFGATLKEGIPSDAANKEKLQDLLLFHSTHSDKVTSLDEYVTRMKSEQKEIYYIVGDTLAQISRSPYLEKLAEKGLEVLLMVDPVDEWLVNTMSDFKGKELRAIDKEGLNLDTEEEKKAKDEQKKKITEEFAPILDLMKSHLKEQVKDVVISERLTATPVCLVSAADEMSAHMQKIMEQMGQRSGVAPKRIMEINPNHPVFKKMQMASASQQQQWSEILFAQALLNEGSALPDPVKFSRQIADLMVQTVS